jgi:hypothetical protein
MLRRITIWGNTVEEIADVQFGLSTKFGRRSRQGKHKTHSEIEAVFRVVEAVDIDTFSTLLAREFSDTS